MKAKKRIHYLLKNRDKKLLATVAIFALALLIFLLTIVALYFRFKVIPNTHFSHFDLGGKNRADVEQVVGRAVEVYNSSKITLASQDKQKEFTPEELGIFIDEDATVEKIFGGRSLPGDILDAKSFFSYKKVTPSYSIDHTKLREKVLLEFGDLEKKSKDASITVAVNKVVLLPSESGVLINFEKLSGDLEEDINLFMPRLITLSLKQDVPTIDDALVNSRLDNFQGIAGVQVNFAYQYDKWSISGKNLYQMLELKRSAVDNELVISLNSEKLDEFLASAKSVINKDARDATLKFEAGKVSEFTSAQDGQVLNVEETKRLVNLRLAEFSLESEKLISVDLPVTVKKARIANKEINSLGIKELIGTGVSYFAGSIPNRVHNIGLGASLINGTIVKPGEVFSFVGLVGPVSADQGFKSAYVIKSGRTVLDDGGGICQVSTTVFRSALNSGLPIVKRTAHAYRVSYYEQKGFKAGLDATIFSPSVDLQFKNDTGNHILVQTTVDKVNSRLQVDIYGTSDGRRVELSEPVVSNIKPAPEPKYEDDPTLPKGVVKQVDFAAAGATSVFNRKVYRGDEVIIDESFKSVFRPWQAVFLVGTAG